ncbi:hypothetical protein [Rehaibacterium terrae]|uniref:Lipoprotein n=1 Tax=Rehaibacterium terrae TaxID=1341696 RepID=A0A7W8DEN0_9GAMM|nr:hypothetical protein [Rehaibacterium terrae]MBB5015810.1 hypothetical protein [Rehaibacterium terrae]
MNTFHRFAPGFVLAWCVIASSGCGPSPEERRAAAQAAAAQRAEAEAAEQWRLYEQNREDGNIELAAAYAELIVARYPATEAARALVPIIDEVRQQAAEAREARRLASLWRYQTAPMAGGIQKTAVIHSSDGGQPNIRLVLRQHSEWGLSTFLLPDADVFDCRRCQVGIAFDAAAPRRFAATKAADPQNPALFIDDKAAFLAALAKAKTMRIEVPVKGGTRTLTFEVGGYAPARFEAGG